MKLHIRYIGAALTEWKARNLGESNLSTAINPMGFIAGDFMTHPHFPDRWLIVQARHIDLIEPSVTLFLDLLPENQSPSDLPRNVIPLTRD